MKSQEIKNNSIVKFKENFNFGSFGEKYILKGSLWNITMRKDNTICIQELDNNKQPNGSIYGCTKRLTSEILKVIEIIE